MTMTHVLELIALTTVLSGIGRSISKFCKEVKGLDRDLGPVGLGGVINMRIEGRKLMPNGHHSETIADQLLEEAMNSEAQNINGAKIVLLRKERQELQDEITERQFELIDLGNKIEQAKRLNKVKGNQK